MRLVFAGTPATAVPSLQALLASQKHEVVAVLTRPHARAGRGRHEVASPVEQVAAAAGGRGLTPTPPRPPALQPPQFEV
jgi:methionyl-tRNA formyltransferase